LADAATLVDDPLPFAIDGFVFDKPSTAEDKTWEDDARILISLEAPQRYTVVVQDVPGYKSITQATEPEALKRIHAVVQTYTKEDREFMDSLDNYAPHEVQCHIFTSSPLLMYFESKTPALIRTGMQKWALQWDLTLVEVNDNQ
jgi:hypothetical protein